MLTETYIEALLVDEDAADEVWEAWDKGAIDDVGACTIWWFIATTTGPRTAESKKKVAQNAFKGGTRPLLRGLAKVLREQEDTLEFL